MCACRNRSNQAQILFLTVTDRDQLNDWMAWTKAFAEQQPQKAVAHYLHTDALARLGDLPAAEEGFSRAIELNLKLALAWVGRGTARAVHGKEDLDPAYIDLLQATQVQPDLAAGHASLGCLEVILQNAEGSLPRFNEALKLDPTSALAYNGRGCARYGLGKPDEAFLDFEMAATLCRAHVIAEDNQSFVEVLVAKKVDEKTTASNKPGTTLETRTGNVGPQSQLLDEKELQAAYEKEGFVALSQRLVFESLDLLTRINESNRWMSEKYGPATAALGNNLMAIESTKVAMRYMSMAQAGPKGGLPEFFGKGAFYLAKDAADKVLDRTVADQPSRLAAKMAIASIALAERNIRLEMTVFPV